MFLFMNNNKKLSFLKCIMQSSESCTCISYKCMMHKYVILHDIDMRIKDAITPEGIFLFFYIDAYIFCLAFTLPNEIKCMIEPFKSKQ